MRVHRIFLVVAASLCTAVAAGACSSSGSGTSSGHDDASTGSSGGSGSSSGGGSGGGSGGSSGSSGGGSGGGSGSGGSSGSSSGGDAGSAAVPECVETCSAPADCATPSVPLYDASHWACQGGFCSYLGCQSSSECTAAYQKSNYACGSVQGSTIPGCYETCSAPADCAAPSVPLYTASHWACNGNSCDYLGCQSSTECTAAYQKSNYACGSVQGSSAPECYETCNAPADCATPSVPLYTASHWACNGHQCVYLGCQASSECTAEYQKANYACH